LIPVIPGKNARSFPSNQSLEPSNGFPTLLIPSYLVIVIPMNISNVKQLLPYHELLFAWTVRTIRARYQQSLLGSLWAILQPASTVAVLTIIFTLIIPLDTADIPYPVFSYVAMVPWVFFSSSLTDMVDSLVGNMNLISKIFFPREILVIAALMARMLDFVIAFIILFLLMFIYRVPIHLTGWPLIPIVLSMQMALALGLGFAGAAMNVFSRDIKHIVALGLQLWFYATPIIYPLSLVPEKYQALYFLNPMAAAIHVYRSVLLYGEVPEISFLGPAVVSLLILFLGYILFKRTEPLFADVV
jgi:lipopolysaccharide transport system permease protein